jgi:hypothetical protein
VPQGSLRIGRTVAITALAADGTAQQPNGPLTVTLSYDPAALGVADPAALTLQRWDGAAWTSAGVTVVGVDAAAHTLTAQITHLSQFALVVPGTRVALPLAFKR